MALDCQQQVRQLQQQLAAREQEVAALREIAEAATELQSQDVQAAKVIELSKKIEKEKQKVAKLQQALSQASSTKEAAAAKPGDTKGSEEQDALSKELAATKDKVALLTKKVGQFEGKVFLLEGENKKLVRALQREVGDEVPLQRVIDEGSDWRGRREQIIHLKDTIRQLKESSATAAPQSAASSSSLAKHEAAHRREIEKMNKERGAEMERMAGELEAAKKQSEQLRLQYCGASSRRKVLEAELVALKDKLGVVLSKTQNDDKLITALRSELAIVSGSKGNSSGAARSGGPEAMQLLSRCSQLEEQVEQQQKIIRYLQGQQAATGQERVDQLQDENEELRQQLVALQDDLAAASSQRPGTSGMSSALRQQVMTLQEENLQLRQELIKHMNPKSPTLQLTQSQRLVLEEAAQAVSESGSGGLTDRLLVDSADALAGGKSFMVEQQLASSSLG